MNRGLFALAAGSLAVAFSIAEAAHAQPEPPPVPPTGALPPAPPAPAPAPPPPAGTSPAPAPVGPPPVPATPPPGPYTPQPPGPTPPQGPTQPQGPAPYAPRPATPPPGYQPPPPPGYGYYPPPPVAPDKSANNHDGFYLRLALGVGYAQTRFKSENALTYTGTTEGTIKGPTGSFELSMGGTVGSGVVIGGGVYFENFANPDSTDVADSSPGPEQELKFKSANMALLGPMVDWYFDPSSGFHAQGAIGLGVIAVSNGREKGSDAITIGNHDSGGWGVMLGVGYDWWVADDWSIGVLGRVLYVAGGKGEENVDFSDTTWKHQAIAAPSVMFTATYH